MAAMYPKLEGQFYEAPARHEGSLAAKKKGRTLQINPNDISQKPSKLASDPKELVFQIRYLTAVTGFCLVFFVN